MVGCNRVVTNNAKTAEKTGNKSICFTVSQERTTKRLEHTVWCISLHCKRAFYKQEIYCYPIGWNVSIFEVALGFSFNCELTAPCFANCFLFRALRLFSFARVEDRNGMFWDRGVVDRKKAPTVNCAIRFVFIFMGFLTLRKAASASKRRVRGKSYSNYGSLAEK